MKLVKGAAIGFCFGIASGMAASSGAAEPYYTGVMEKDIKWQDAPSIGPGAKTAVIDGDPKSSGPFVMRLKLPPKTTIGVHTHPTTESVTVLSGTLYFAAGDKLNPKAAKAFGPGSYFSIEQGKPMFAYTTDKEVTLQLHGNGPWGITYLDAKEAAKKAGLDEVDAPIIKLINMMISEVGKKIFSIADISRIQPAGRP